MTYPSSKNDPSAIEGRNSAVQFLVETLNASLGTSTHQPLTSTKSADNRFELVVVNQKHVIAPGNGTLVDGQSSVSMALSGQQATMGVKAEDFGTGKNPDLILLEKAPWYDATFRDEGAQGLQMRSRARARTSPR